MNDNPYEAPSSNLVGLKADSESASIREAHIKHEASIKSVGILYYIGGALMLISAPGLLILSMQDGSELSQLGNLNQYVSVFYAVFGVASLIVGRGLRTLRSWVKIPVGILSGLGLLSVPVGTIINGYILYLVFSAKGKTIFSDEYKLVIEQTPDIKYKTPTWVWVLVAVLFAFIALALYFAVTSDSS